MKIDFIFQKFGKDSIDVLLLFKNQTVKLPTFNLEKNNLIRCFNNKFGSEAIDFFKRYAGSRFYISQDPINQYLKFKKYSFSKEILKEKLFLKKNTDL